MLNMTVQIMDFSSYQSEVGEGGAGFYHSEYFQVEIEAPGICARCDMKIEDFSLSSLPKYSFLPSVMAGVPTPLLV